MRSAEGGIQVLHVEPTSGVSGTRPTFRHVFETELSFVWNTLRRFGVAERDLEDVAHEVFVVVDRLLGEYDPTRPLRPWLFAIAFRCASDDRKRARHRHETLVADDVDSVDPTEAVDEALIHHHEKNLARRALLAVPEERRAVVILHDFEDVTMRDIAEAFRIPLKTAYSRLRVGREELVASARRLRKDEGR